MGRAMVRSRKINGGSLPSSYTPTYQITQNGCYNGSEYDYHLYCWDKVWVGYAALLAEVGYKQDTYLNELKFELNNKGGLSTRQIQCRRLGARQDIIVLCKWLHCILQI
mgnify:CR=1 FL=1